MTIDEAIKQVAADLGLEEYVVRRAYYSMFEFIKETAMEMPLKEKLLDKEEFKELKKVFYMPTLGKVTIPYPRYKKIWEAYLDKKAKRKNKNGQHDIQTEED